KRSEAAHRDERDRPEPEWLEPGRGEESEDQRGNPRVDAWNVPEVSGAHHGSVPRLRLACKAQLTASSASSSPSSAGRERRVRPLAGRFVSVSSRGIDGGNTSGSKLVCSASSAAPLVGRA